MELADAVQRAAFVEFGLDLPVQLDRAVATPDGLGEITELLVGEAERCQV
ncbi:hypothetical protein [Amycolatopsis taiwanensis]|nr:hypothetical protein [Amycolatopsis taiwanensis]